MWKEVGRGKKCLLAVSVLDSCPATATAGTVNYLRIPTFLLPLSLIDDDDDETSAQPLNCFSSAD